MPELKRAYEKFKGRDVEFIGISLDQDAEDVLSYCKSNGLTWPQFCDPEKAWETDIALQWGVRGIPRTMLLDKQGNVLSMDARFIEHQLPDLLRK